VYASPARTLATSSSCSACFDAGTIGTPGRPIISARVQPKIRSAAAFQRITRVSRSTSMIASGDDSITAWRRSPVW
jgi:hypothetical protein